MSKYSKLPDGSIQHQDGRIIYMAWEKFKTSIIESGCCFICGAASGTKEFNNEHILPRWLLTKYNLFGKKITLPNLTEYTYGEYTIPCCKECNSYLGEQIENPVSKIFEGGHSEVAAFLADDKCPGLLFIWLSLIVLKTHLKDNTLVLNQDKRTEDNKRKISDLYHYGEFHHLHCIARAPYTEACLDQTAFGSFLVLPAKVNDKLYESFDFADVTSARSVLLRIGDVAIISVLDDSCAVLSKLWKYLERITGPLSPIQLREILAHFSYVSQTLKERPQNQSFIDDKDDYVIFSTHPSEVEIDDYEPRKFGALLHSLCLQFVTPHEKDKYGEAMKNGRCSFLYDENGKFIKDSMVLARS